MENDEYRRNDTIEDETTILSADAIKEQTEDPAVKKKDKKTIGLLIPIIIFTVLNIGIAIYMWNMFAVVAGVLSGATNPGDGGEALGLALAAVFMLIFFFMFAIASAVTGVISTVLSSTLVGHLVRSKQKPVLGIIFLVVDAILLVSTVAAVIVVFVVGH